MSEKSISEMSKDQLNAYVRKNYGGIELDLSRPIKELRQEVQNLQDGKKEKNVARASVKQEIKFLRHRLPKHDDAGKLLVYPATEYLLKSDDDLIPCDAKGKAIVADVEDE